MFKLIVLQLDIQPICHSNEVQSGSRLQGWRIRGQLVEAFDGEKHLVLVTGGPGTGKSVIAIQLMSELSRKGVPTIHVTNSSSFTTVMRALVQKAGHRVWGSAAVEGLFRMSLTG